MNKHPDRTFLAATLILLAASLTQAQPTFQQIVLTGEAAPGAGGAVFSDLFAPSINAAGDVVFLAELGGDAITFDNNLAIYGPSSGAGSSLGVIARTGDAAPGAGGATYSSLSGRTINDSGDVAFLAELAGTGVTTANDQGIFGPATGAGSSLDLVVRSGSAAPGAGGALYDLLGIPGLNASGDLVFSATLITGPTGPTVTNANESAVFGPTAGAGSTLGLLAREDDAVPGAGGAEYNLFTNPRLNDAGVVAFNATLRTGDTGPAVTTSNDSSLIVGAGGSLSQLLREGDAVPGTGGDAFRGSFGDVGINNSGDVSFHSNLLSTGDVIVFGPTSGAGSPAGVLAQEGGIAPGTGGAIFGDDIDEDPTINNQGDVVFEAERLEAGTGDPVVTDDNEDALYAYLDGTPQIVVRTGDTLDVLLGDGSTETKTIGGIGWTGGGLNDSRQVAVSLRFEDLTEGIFVFSLAAEEIDPDFNGDGFVDAADYTVWRDGAAAAEGHDAWAANFEPNTTPPAAVSVSVPEPAGIGLAAIAIAGWRRRRR